MILTASAVGKVGFAGILVWEIFIFRAILKRMFRTHIKSIFNRDTSQFRLAQEARRKAYPEIRRVRSDAVPDEIGRITKGFRYFFAPLCCAWVGVPTGTPLSARLAERRKYQTTRFEAYF